MEGGRYEQLSTACAWPLSTSFGWLVGAFLRFQEQYMTELPPILQVKGLRLIEIGEDRRGTYLKFIVARNRLREVTLYMQASSPVTWTYTYAMWDPDTRTVITYEGRHGDPAKDRRVDIRGA
jgi:hypothetical protein